jgi:hypothetical protein
LIVSLYHSLQFLQIAAGGIGGTIEATAGWLADPSMYIFWRKKLFVDTLIFSVDTRVTILPIRGICLIFDHLAFFFCQVEIFSLVDT